MEFDAVDVLTPYARQVCHADELAPNLINTGEAIHFALIAREPFTHYVEEAAIDLVDDFKMTG